MFFTNRPPPASIFFLLFVFPNPDSASLLPASSSQAVSSHRLSCPLLLNWKEQLQRSAAHPSVLGNASAKLTALSSAVLTKPSHSPGSAKQKQELCLVFRSSKREHPCNLFIYLLIYLQYGHNFVLSASWKQLKGLVGILKRNKTTKKCLGQDESVQTSAEVIQG